VRSVTGAKRRLHWLALPARSTLAACRREGSRGAGPCQEIAVNHFFTEIGRRCDNFRSYDDIASGIAGIAFCICCTAIFSAVFVGSI
jgi:hypothetical protein